jgi:hypothetical protein
MKQQILTQDETIAEITAKHQANAELEIEKFKLSFEVDDARNTLTGKFYSQHDLIDSELAKKVKSIMMNILKQQVICYTSYSDKKNQNMVYHFK